MRKRLHTLQMRFTMAAIVGAAAFAAIVGSFAYHGIHRDAVQDGRATLQSLADAVDKTAAIGAYAGDRVLLQELVDGLGRSPLVGSVAVRTPQGQTMASSRAKPNPPAGSAGAVVLERALASPFHAGTPVGYLRIEADMARLEGGARLRAATVTGLLVLQILLLALMLYAAAAYFVSRPIGRLARELGRMQPGTDERLPTPPLHARDEIGSLIAGANTLLAATDRALQRERELRQAVEAMEAQYRQIFDATSAGIFVLDAQGRLINGNPTVLRLIGSPVQEMRALQAEDFLRLAFARPESAQAMVARSRSTGGTVSGDLEIVHRDGAARWVHCLISVQGRSGGDVPAPPHTVEGVMYDITERKHTEAAVRHRADHDLLTGLRNRASSDRALDRYIAAAHADGSTVSVIYIDLDGFKVVNDTFGHQAGDQVLQECARRLQSSLRRTSDLAGRLGGDEFIIAMPGLGPDDLTLSSVAGEVAQRLGEPIVLNDGSAVRVGASLGIASYPHHGVNRKQLAAAADAAMYDVKRHGKQGYAMAWRADTPELQDPPAPTIVGETSPATSWMD